MIFPSTRWLSKPLCRRYAFAEFNTLCLPVSDNASVKDLHWRWALGLSKQDEYEVLGVWPSHEAFGRIAQDLRERGVERIGAIAAACDGDLTAKYFDAAVWPPAEGNLVGTAQNRLRALPLRRRAALRSAAATAERLQATLSQAIRRRAPFADQAAAAAFLAQQLEKAERSCWTS